MCSFLCEGFLKHYFMPDIFIHNFLKILAILALRRMEGCHGNLTLKFHTKFKEKFVNYDIILIIAIAH